jgi:hypothetical protein
MATTMIRESIKVKKHEVPVFDIFYTISNTEPLDYNTYKQHLEELNKISPFMNFFQTGLHRVKRDPIMSNGRNRTANKLHLDFIPFAQLDIRVLEIAGKNEYFISTIHDNRYKNCKRGVP